MSTPLSPNEAQIFLEPREDRVNARVSKGLRDALERMALAEGRSLSNYVEQIILAHVTERGLIVHKGNKP